MAFDIEGARRAGYTDDEIADHLGAQRGLDTKAARAAGYTSRELLAELSDSWARRQLPTGVQPSAAGAGRGGIGGPTAGQLAAERQAAAQRASAAGLASVQPPSQVTPEFAMGGPMPETLEPKRSLLETPPRGPMPGQQPLIEQRGAPVADEVMQATVQQLAAMPREQRIAQEQRQDLPGWMRNTVAAANRLLDASDQGARRTGTVGPTLESRTERNMQDGADLPTARAAAVASASAGLQTRGLPQATAGQGLLTADEVNANRAEGARMQRNSLGARGLYAAQEGLVGGTAGVIAAGLRAIGDEETAKLYEKVGQGAAVRAQAVNELQRMQTAAREAGILPSGPLSGMSDYMGEMAVGAANSVGQMIPGLVAGIATGNAAVGMGMMALPVFGQSYVAKRDAGGTPAAAAGYAGAMAALEIIGERYGLMPAALNAFRKEASTKSLEELPGFVERGIAAMERRGMFSKPVGAVMRTQAGEQVGEQITGAGQYLLDGTELGLDQPISVAGFLTNARDTAVQTLLATGAVQAAGAGAKAVIEQAGRGDPGRALGQALGEDVQGTEFQRRAIDGYAARAGDPRFYDPTFIDPRQTTRAAAEATPAAPRPRPAPRPPTMAGTAQAGPLPGGRVEPTMTPAAPMQPEPAGRAPAAQAVDNITGILQQAGALPQDGQDFTGLDETPAAPVIATPLDEAAHAAATSPTNDRPEPTQAQKEAGNYAKGHVRIAGMDFAIENPQGSVRRGVDPDGNAWETPLVAHYGYAKGTRAGDGDHSDVFIKPGTPEDYAGPVFVIDQVDQQGRFDEHKTIIGAATEEEARALYLGNYTPGWAGLGAITQLPIDAYKSWVRDGVKRKPLGNIQRATDERIADAGRTAQPGTADGAAGTGIAGVVQGEQPGAGTAGPAGAVAAGAVPSGGAVRAGPAGGDEALKPADTTHLNTLMESLSRERARLAAAKTPGEQEARRVKVAQIEREIAGERKFLGLPPESAPQISDDELLAELQQPEWAATAAPAAPAAPATPAAPTYTEGQRVTIAGTPYTVAKAGKASVTLQGQDGKRRVVSVTSDTFKAIKADAQPAPSPEAAEASPQTAAPAPAAPAVVPGARAGAVEADGVAGAVSTTEPMSRLGAVMRRAGWEIDYIDLDLTGGQPKADIRIKRGDGRFVIAKVDGQGRATMETFQRTRSLGIDPKNKQARLAPQIDDQFLGRQKFEGARSMLRGMVTYLADNATNPVALADMKAAWAGVMAAPTNSAAALPAPTPNAAAPVEADSGSAAPAPAAAAPASQPKPETAEPTRGAVSQPEAEAQAPAAGKQYPVTAEGAIQAFNGDDSAQAVAIMARLKLDDLKTVGDAVGFRPQYNETAKAFRERIGAVAGALEKTSREKARRQRVLFDKLTDRAMSYDRAADHAARAKANGVADDSTAYDSFYTPMGGGETQMMRIPALLDRLAVDVQSLRGDPDYADVAPLVQKARPRVFEHKASAPAPQAAPEPANPAAEVSAILNAAAEPPKGKERLDVLKDVKAGAITPDEVAAAYPAATTGTESLNKRHSVPKKQVLTPAGALKADATNSRADSAVWYYQGDIGALQFKANVTVNGQPDRGADEAKRLLVQIKAAQDAGWRRANYRAGSLGTVWVYERGNEFLTRAGMENAAAVEVQRPVMPEDGPGWDKMVARQRALARAFNDWLLTLPEDQQYNRGVVSRKMGETPVGDWAGIGEDKLGLTLRYFPGPGEKQGMAVGWSIQTQAKPDWPALRDYIAELAAEADSAAPQQDAAQATEPAKPATLLDQFKAAIRAMHDGTATVEDFRAAYARVKDAATAKAELAKMTKDELVRTFGIMERPGEKKDSLVNTAHQAMLRAFALGKDYGPRSYMMTRDGLAGYEKARADALDALVEATTAEDLAAFAAEQKKDSELRAARRAEMVEAIKNPKTLDDYRQFIRFHQQDGKTFKEARMMLTPEQRAAFDDLTAAESRGKRGTAKEDAQTRVQSAGQTTAGEIIATKHTRDGHDLWVVKLADRVSRDDYMTLLAGAKRLGGNYSSYRGNGAVPGFQFRTPDAAQAFLKLAGGDTAAATEAAKARRDAFEDDRSQSAVERLNEMAARLDERADESLNRDRKANTERRARFAASAEASAQADKAMAQTMRNIAQSIGSGGAKFLDRVRQKVQVELLQRFVASAKYEELRAKFPTYAEQERHRGEPPTMETADYAEFPQYTAYRSDLASLGRQLSDAEGTKAIGQRLLKVADDVSDAFMAFAKEPGNLFRLSTFSVRAGDEVRTAIFPTREGAERAIKRSGLTGKAIVFPEKRGVNRIIMSPSEAIARGIWKGDADKRITLSDEFGAELVEKIGKAARRGSKVSVPWQFEAVYDRRKTLARMGIETPAEMRAALREFITLRQQPEEASRVKQLERAMVGRRNDGLDFFPTPEAVADEMVEAADIQPGMRVLEPSAGMGHIAERIRASEVEPDVAEFSADRRELLEAKGFNVVAQDFMALEEGGYDRILMNPPFSDGRDIQHVRHAYGLLKPGGRLVAIMGEGAFFRQDKRATEFRDWLESIGATDEKLPEGTFNDPSLPVNTSANARMVVIDKPAAGDDGTRFSRATDTDTEADFSRRGAKRGVNMRDAEAVVAGVRAAMPTAPQMVLHESVDQAPAELREQIEAAGAANDVEAVYFRGTIHVFPQHFRSLERLEFVVAHHELRHHGLGAILGPRLDQTMMRIYRTNAKVRAAADANIRAGLTDSVVIATEEALADMPVEALVKLNGWKRIETAIRDWLRAIAQRLQRTMPRLAAALDPKDWTDADIARLVARAEDMSRSGDPQYVRGGAVFGRDQSAGMRGSEAEAIAAGFTLKAYRGISKASPFNDTGTTWLTTSREVAEAYAEEVMGYDDPGVLEVMVRPDGLPRHDASRLTDEQREELQADDFGNPQAVGIYDRSDDHPLGGSRRNVTVIHAPRSAVWAVDDGAKLSRAQPTDPTQTEAFRRWFAGSKVVDSQGRPLVMYHGTTADFSAFKDGDNWFSSDAADANIYGGLNSQGAKVIPVFLQIRNPRIVNGVGMTTRQIQDAVSLLRSDEDGLLVLDNGRIQWAITANDGRQIKSATGNRGTFDPADPDIRFSRAPKHDPDTERALGKAGIRQPLSIREHLGRAAGRAMDLVRDRAELMATVRQGLLDQFSGIQRAVQRDLGGLPLDQDPYIAARLANGGTSSVMRGLLLHGQARWADNGQHLEKIPDTKGLLDILAPLGEDIHDWFGWMIGNRAARLAREGRENNFTDDDIRRLQALATPEKKAAFQKAAMEYAAFKRSVLDVAQAAGLINPETRKTWDYADYIPFYRQIDAGADGVAAPRLGRKGLAGQSSGIRVLRGGEAALNDPIENLLMNFSRLIDASLKNNAIAKTIRLLEEAGSEAVHKVGYDFTSAVVPAEQMRKLLVSAGTPEEVLGAIPPEVFDGMAKLWALQAPTDPEVVRVMVGGRPQFYRVNDPLLLRSLTSFVPFDFPGLGVMRAAKRLLTSMVTATPEFLVRNFIRDSVAAQAITRAGFSPTKSFAGIVKSWRETGGAEAMLFAGASFGSGQVNAADPSGTAAELRRALRARGMSAAGIDSYMATLLDSPAKLWERWRNVTDAVENANREAVYEAANRSGGGATAAAYEAKDLMDFSLRGSWPAYQLLADVVPFLNARVQGLYRLGRADPKRLTAVGGLLMVATLLLALQNDGEDWYEELPDWDKDTNWHFRIGGQHFRIPKPFELGVIFAAIPERIGRSIKGLDDADKTAARLWANVRDQLAFDPVPQLIRPILNVWGNWDTFRQAPIETERDEGKLPAQRYDARTSDTARVVVGAAAPVTNELGLSPKRLEYLVTGYFGTVGAYALGLSDMAVRKIEGKPQGPSLRPDDVPLVRAFYRVDPARATVYESDLYLMRQEVEQIYRSVTALQKDDQAAAAELATKEQDKLALRSVIVTATKRLAALRRQADAIYADRGMSPEEKRAQLDALQVQRNAIAKQVATMPEARAAF